MCLRPTIRLLHYFQGHVALSLSVKSRSNVLSCGAFEVILRFTKIRTTCGAIQTHKFTDLGPNSQMILHKLSYDFLTFRA